jgi:hypothetical protein
VIITGNRATFSPSLRRRSLMVELFLKEARFEDHVFQKPLEIEDIKKQRESILEALWKLIYRWQKIRILVGFDPITIVKELRRNLVVLQRGPERRTRADQCSQRSRNRACALVLALGKRVQLDQG